MDVEALRSSAQSSRIVPLQDFASVRRMYSMTDGWGYDDGYAKFISGGVMSAHIVALKRRLHKCRLII